VQQKEDQSESRANWIEYVAVATNEGGAAHARQARHRSWRGAAPSRYIYWSVSDDAKVHDGEHTMHPSNV
jgi:hypothetical protein